MVFWTEAFWPAIGGVEVLASRLLPALSQRRHEILVVTDDDMGRLPSQDEFRSIVVRRPSMRAALLSRSPERIAAVRAETAALMQAFRPEIVHLNCPGASGFFLRRTPTSRRVPLLATLHSERAMPSGGSATLVAKLVADADWVTAVSEQVLAAARLALPSIASRSSVVYNAVEEPAEEPQPLPFDPPVLLYLGRLAPEKGVDRALMTLSRVASIYPHIRLVVAGDGPERPTLEAQATQLGIRDAIDFVGWVSPARVPALINSATLVLMPSRWEGLPLAGIEAALMARPIVGTPVGGLAELVENGVTGLLVNGAPTELADAVVSLLGDRDRATAMGWAARRRAQALFGWGTCVDSYDRMYEKVRRENVHGRVG
ncbi:MAG: glycosyltransferase family 4 protein [Deltaproteobacteria bacterium]|nr:glycosyltransferase family 4 protein [Deltaproteobacteria bacterium]